MDKMSKAVANTRGYFHENPKMAEAFLAAFEVLLGQSENEIDGNFPDCDDRDKTAAKRQASTNALACEHSPEYAEEKTEAASLDQECGLGIESIVSQLIVPKKGTRPKLRELPTEEEQRAELEAEMNGGWIKVDFGNEKQNEDVPAGKTEDNLDGTDVDYPEDECNQTSCETEIGTEIASDLECDFSQPQEEDGNDAYDAHKGADIPECDLRQFPDDLSNENQEDHKLITEEKENALNCLKTSEDKNKDIAGDITEDDSDAQIQEKENNEDENGSPKVEAVELERDASKSAMERGRFRKKPYFTARQAEEITGDIGLCMDDFVKLFVNRVWNICKDFIPEPEEGEDEIADPEGFYCYDDELEKSILFPAYEECIEIVKSGFYTDEETGRTYECGISKLPTPDDGIGFICDFERKDIGPDVVRIFSKVRFRNVWGDDVLVNRGGRSKEERLRIARENTEMLKEIMRLGDKREIDRMARIEKVIYNFTVQHIRKDNDEIEELEAGSFMNRRDLMKFIESNRKHGISLDEFLGVLKDGTMDDTGSITLRISMFDAHKVAEWKRRENDAIEAEEVRKRREEERQRLAAEKAESDTESQSGEEDNEDSEEEPQVDTTRRRTGPRKLAGRPVTVGRR